VEHFASGWKRNYYGKGDVIVYRLNRDGRVPEGQSPVFGANVLMLTYGDAFWPTYATGDNTGLVATDSMKNFIQRETMNFAGDDLPQYCRFLASKFLDCYPQAEGLQVSASEIPYACVDDVAFAPAGPERAIARVELTRASTPGAQGASTRGVLAVTEATAGLRGFRLLRLGGSAFGGFVRDEYTTLPDIANRPLHMWLDLEWRHTDVEQAFSGGTAAQARRIVRNVFREFESGSIQQIVYKMGTRMLEEIPTLAEVHLEANNRTWDTVTERGAELGVYTDARPPYGCLGLRLKR
jgi:urate oxidase / 2-oxo-4-hydroxy-4-carboxy-5-ureidoimidazoline decarboxylase